MRMDCIRLLIAFLLLWIALHVIADPDGLLW